MTHATEIMRQMAKTYMDRTGTYGGDFSTVGRLLAVLFPDSVSPDLLHGRVFPQLVQVLNKIARFAASGCTHVDSVHDAAVYCAIIEAELSKEQPVQLELPL